MCYLFKGINYKMSGVTIGLDFNLLNGTPVWMVMGNARSNKVEIS